MDFGSRRVPQASFILQGDPPILGRGLGSFNFGMFYYPAWAVDSHSKDLACGFGPRNECCCCEQPISEQQKNFAVKQLDAHNNNIHFVAPIHTLDIDPFMHVTKKVTRPAPQRVREIDMLQVEQTAIPY